MLVIIVGHYEYILELRVCWIWRFVEYKLFLPFIWVFFSFISCLFCYLENFNLLYSHFLLFTCCFLPIESYYWKQSRESNIPTLCIYFSHCTLQILDCSQGLWPTFNDFCAMCEMFVQGMRPHLLHVVIHFVEETIFILIHVFSSLVEN